MSCPLCKHDSDYFGTYQGRIYNRCTFCASVFLDPNDLPSAKAEKKRYDKHENSLDNKGYLQFLEPLRNVIIKNESATQTGLDYGCGPNPVLSKLLKKEGFTVKQYDIY
ncbi:MAG: methyltransferase, partial [Leeuwenhoekiella sp.]|nr:methyltransferase [Leeuwenhoekiella sp.]